MIFRKATQADIDRIAEIIFYASQRLHKAGIDQWQRGYPNRQSIENDVENGVGMVLSLGSEILAYGAVIFTGEKAYDDLTGGLCRRGNSGDRRASQRRSQPEH